MNNTYFNNFTHQNFKELSNWLNHLDPYEFTVTAIIASLLIAPTLNANQQNSVGNFLELIGQILLTVGAQEITVQQATQNNTASTGLNDATNTSTDEQVENSSTTNNYEQDIAELRKEIENLKNMINNQN